MLLENLLDISEDVFFFTSQNGLFFDLGDLGGGFKNFFFALLGEMIQFDEHIFQMGSNHQPVIASDNTHFYSF